MIDLEVTIPGGELRVWHRPAKGDASTVVLVHGLTGNSRWWGRVIAHLPRTMGVIAPDLRGRGGSLAAPPPYDLRTMSDDLARCLDRLEVEREVIAGYSMGAWIAADFGLRHRDRVQRLLLLDGGLAGPVDTSATAEEIIQSLVGPALARLDIEFPDQTAFLEYWKAHPALRAHWDEAMAPCLVYELVETGDGGRVAVSRPAVEVAATQITVDPETRDLAALLQIPATLVVVERGTADQEGGMVPKDLAERVAANTPSLEVRYLEGLNHYTLVLGAGASTVASLASGTG